jgi:curli biogenesis system outer membrane secretion channel CsgG
LLRLSYILTCAAISVGCLSGCATTPESPGMRSVAVWDLENLSMEASSRPDLGQLLSYEIMQSITDSGDIQVVERQKLVAILEELRLGTSELADESARLKVGRMIGAQEMVFGGYMVVGSTMRIDLRRVDVETGRVLKTAKKTADAGDLSGWLNAAREAAALLFGDG